MSGQIETSQTAVEKSSQAVIEKAYAQFKSAAFNLLAVMTGLMLFAAAAIYVTDSSVLSPARHLELASKYNIYSGVSGLINKTIGTMSDALSGNTRVETQDKAADKNQAVSTNDGIKLFAADSSEQEKLIQLNVDNMINGMMKYFNGGSSFLPDIYLQLPDTIQKSSRASNKISADNSLKLPSISGAGIDKINLSAVIMYTNRYDVSDDFTLIRLLHNIAAKLPIILASTSLAAFLAGLLLKSNKKKVGEFIKLSAVTIGIAGFIFTGAIIYLINVTIPSVLKSQTQLISVPAEVISGYASSLLQPAIILFISFALMLPASFLASKSIRAFQGVSISGAAKPFKAENSSAISNNNYNSNNTFTVLTGKRLHIIAVSLSAMFLAVALANTSILLNKLESNGFAGVFGRVAGINPQIEVIPAMNQTVYSLEVRLQDKKSGLPITDVLVDITGGKTGSARAISLNKLSDTEGSARFFVHQGYYQVSFPSEMLPAGYKQPAPITVDVETAGTTLVTIDLEQDEELITETMNETIPGMVSKQVTGVTGVTEKAITGAAEKTGASSKTEIKPKPVNP